MFIRIIVPVIASIALSQAAFAQATGGSSGSSATQSSQSLPQQIQQKLKDQGFTNVQVVPGSFLVSAKDKQGDPVTMIIGPNSMTVFTMSTSQGSTTGSGGGKDQSGSSSK